MKKVTLILTLIFSLFLFTSFALATGPKLVWDASTNETGYTLYTTDGTIRKTVSKDILEIPISDLNLIPGKEYTFYVKAYNSVDESVPSNMVSYTQPAYVPLADILLPKIDLPQPVIIKNIQVILGQ
jgi:hypothetical protein